MGDTLLPMASGIAEFVMRTGTAILLPEMCIRDRSEGGGGADYPGGRAVPE